MKSDELTNEECRRWLNKIEQIARGAFNNPDTQDINLYRAQKLADIFAIFEYNGATIQPSRSSEIKEDDNQITFDEAIAEALKEEA